MSTPVPMPLRPSAYSRSSVAMLPVAAGANGHPPIPPLLASSAVTPASMAARALAYPVFLVLWKWQRSGASVTLRTALASVRTSRGTATPIVSASATSFTPASAHWRTMSVTRSGRTSPSNGQPNAAPTVSVTRRPASRAAAAMPAVARTASAVVIPWFFAENVSVATTTMLISSTPAATARSIPRRFSTRPL